MRCFFNVKNAKISGLKIHGDFFGTKDVAEIEKLLKGCEYEKNAVSTKLAETDLKSYFGAIEKDEFIGMFFR